jgi:hypothetical protein
MLQILCISGAFIPIVNLCGNLLISKGKSDIFMWNTISLVIIQLGIALILYPYGIYTLISVYAGINIAWLLVWHHFVSKEIGYSLFALMKDLLPYLFIAGGVMAITWFCTSYSTDIYVAFIAKIGMAASLYILIMWLSGSATFKESVHYLLKRKKAQATITLVPVGGLANRMKAIDAAVGLAQEANARLHIIWFKDKGLNCRFDQLFRSLELKGVTLKEASWTDKLIFDRPRRKNFHLPRLFQRVLFDDCIYEHEATQRFYRKFDFLSWTQGKNVYIASCVYFHPQTVRPLFRIFQPIEKIQEQIKAFTDSFSRPTMGIHIRRTDNIASISQSPTELFIEKMREEICKNEDCQFYVATDSEEEKIRLKDIFGERILTLPRAADRNSIAGMQDALVELYVLSHTRKIMGSMQSSYSETAAQISNIRCELLTKKA